MVVVVIVVDVAVVGGVVVSVEGVGVVLIRHLFTPQSVRNRAPVRSSGIGEPGAHLGRSR